MPLVKIFEYKFVSFTGDFLDCDNNMAIGYRFEELRDQIHPGDTFSFRVTSWGSEDGHETRTTFIRGSYTFTSDDWNQSHKYWY